MFDRFQRYVNPQSTDSESQSQQDLTAEPVENTSLSYETRIYCFTGCFILSMLCSILSSPLLVVGKLTGFAVMISVGSFISIGGTFFLSAPLTQLKRMFDSSRLIATLAYLSMIVLTLVSGLVFKSPLLAVICIVGQYLTMAWYSLSYIPYARQMVSSCVSKLF